MLSHDTQADVFLKPRLGKHYLKIVDYVDKLLQVDSERLIADDGNAQLLLNFGPKRTKLEDISIPQYVMASIRISYTSIETGQISNFESIKQT